MENLRKRMEELHNRSEDEKSRDVVHEGQYWLYEKAGLEQGAYTALDPGVNHMAVILPHDRAKPIERGQNARLMTRGHHADKWEEQGTWDLRSAMTQGNRHCVRYMKAFGRHLDEHAPDARPITDKQLEAAGKKAYQTRERHLASALPGASAKRGNARSAARMTAAGATEACYSPSN
jgi:hypothetical protein